MKTKSKVLFITATSGGFGRIWAEAALKRGDRVIATARNIADIDELVAKYKDAILPVQLDVTDKEAGFAAIQQGWKHFGRIDVVLNVAGFSLYGAVEEATEFEARTQLETNFFGPFWITQAALPIMRMQGGGHIIQVSSIGGVVTFPTLGLYHASKWALEALSETLAQEVKAFGIDVTIIEPGVYETSPDEKPVVQERVIGAYDEVRNRLYSQFGAKKGDPHATADILLKIIDEPNPPLRLFLGTLPYAVVTGRYQERLQTWEKWKAESDAAQGN
jgi:NAD(P)-dependent dehydrogenase (short-subunit alcohol dehydrogenase family)